LGKSIGIDIGGTNIRLVVIDTCGNVYYKKERETEYYKDDYLKNIDEMILSALEQYKDEIVGIGIGVPGTVNFDSGEVIISTALKWEQLNLKEYIEKKFGVISLIENDCNVWTIAEKLIGAGKYVNDFVMVTIGTGIGAGVYINGRLHRGFNYEAGEIGYFPIGLESYENQASYCNFGYFEKNASATGVANRYKEIKKIEMSSKDIFNLSEEGDQDALMITDKVYRYLGIGMSNIICLLNPEKIIFGGGMAKQGEIFISRLEENINRLTPIKTTLQLSETSEFGGAIGSGLMIFNKI